MNKIEKFLRKLDPNKKLVAEECIEKILSGNTDWLDIKKLKGKDDEFRVRKGNLRIIFQRNTNGVIILDIVHRSDNTY